MTLRYPTPRGRVPGPPALDAVTLRVDRGERVAVVGPSGAGKTSILALANTSLAPTDGTVHLFGVDPTSLADRPLRSLRRRVGTIHQQLHLAGPLRVVHNVNAGHLGRWSAWRAWSSLVRPAETVDARAVLDSLGIGDKLWERTDRLSGGERQRVAIARVLTQRPDLILADEPVASLDPHRSREVLDILCGQAAADDRSLLVSLHAFELAVEYFDRVIGLRAGRVIFDRPADRVDPRDATALYRIEPTEIEDVESPAQDHR
ncbi:MAG: ATP-binding cassette domain-containing protein [Actinomycetota bacterium]